MGKELKKIMRNVTLEILGKYDYSLNWRDLAHFCEADFGALKFKQVWSSVASFKALARRFAARVP